MREKTNQELYVDAVDNAIKRALINKICFSKACDMLSKQAVKVKNNDVFTYERVNKLALIIAKQYL